MRKMLLLLLGLLLIFILSYFCFMGKAEGIKSDLLSSANTAYADKSMSWVSTEMEGKELKSTRIMTLTGTAPTLMDKEEAGKIAGNIEGVTAVNNQIVVADASAGNSGADTPQSTAVVANPYLLEVTKTKEKKIILSGYVPTALVHSELVRQAQELFGAENVTDELKEASNAPAQWSKSASLGVDKLELVDYGHFKMQDETFNFKGYVGSEVEKENIIAGLKARLAGNYSDSYKIDAPQPVVAEVTAPAVPEVAEAEANTNRPTTEIAEAVVETPMVVTPYILEAVKSEDGKIVLTGYVPTVEVHHALVTQAETLYGAEKVTDELKEASTAPTAWAKSVALGLEKLSQMDYGHVKMQDESFNFEGYVGSDAKKEELLSGLHASLATNYSDTYDIKAPKIESVRTPAVTPVATSEAALSCQESFKEELSSEKINFAYNKAIIKKKSYNLLDKLIGIAKKCPTNTIVIEGHTDADGSQSYNQKLSERRANAVKVYLVQHGVKKERLESIGYGELQPIATNKTKAGKEQNRRIEFNVKGVE